MANKRNYEWPTASAWNGFFTQDSVGGITEKVSPDVVIAGLLASGKFVRVLGSEAGRRAVACGTTLTEVVRATIPANSIGPGKQAIKFSAHLSPTCIGATTISIKLSLGSGSNWITFVTSVTNSSFQVWLTGSVSYFSSTQAVIEGVAVTTDQYAGTLTTERFNLYSGGSFASDLALVMECVAGNEDSYVDFYSFSVTAG